MWTWRGLEGGHIEAGAMLVHGENARTLEVIREAGLTVGRPGARSGFSRGLINGRVHEMRDLLEEAMVEGLWSLEAEVAAFDGKDRPLTEELVDRGWPPLRRQVAAELFAQTWCADPELLSVEGVARVEHGWRSGRENFVVQEGYDLLPGYIAREVDVRMATPVRRVEWSAGRVEVHTAEGGRFPARACVIAVPPPLVARHLLLFGPELPPAKVDAVERIPLGPAVRMAVHLKRPAPEGGRLAVLGDVGGFWNISPGSRILTGWIGGPAARRVARMPAGEVVSGLVEGLPWVDRELIEDVRIVNWAGEPYTLGGYTYPRVGALDAPAAWAQPVADTLFFCGEATCGDIHPATVHGAMESGLRAADEVHAALGR